MKKKWKSMNDRVARLEVAWSQLEWNEFKRTDAERERAVMAQRSADAFKQRFDEINAMRAEYV